MSGKHKSPKPGSPKDEAVVAKGDKPVGKGSSKEQEKLTKPVKQVIPL